MKKVLIFILCLVPLLCSGQGTWYGEYSFFAGGGSNDIFRFKALHGGGSVTGTGMWTGGLDLRKLFGDSFSIETGVSYSHQYFFTSPDPGIEGDDRHGSFGMITIPVTARVDFLKGFFADAGALIAFQTGSPHIDNMTGLGATVGAGFQYMFKQDIFVRVRAYASQYGLLHFIPDDHPRTLFNGGFTVGVGYRFIHLGKCNCPADNGPRRRFY